MEVPSGGGLEIYDLPQEMLEVVLDKLPIADLLRCRLVSKLWKSISTELCRQRHVKLRKNWLHDPNGFDIFKVFEHGDIPWSSYALSDVPNLRALTRPFLELFGNNLRKTRVQTMVYYSTPTEDLQRTPNLRSLILDYFPHSSKEDPLQLEPLSLPMLKKLKFEYFTTGAIGFLESHICSPRLELLKIGVLTLEDRESAERASSLFAKIPIIDLPFPRDTPPEVFTGLSTNGLLRVRKLSCAARGRSSLGNYEGFFAGLDLKYLMYLELDIEVLSGDLETPFQFPICPNLKELRISLDPSRPDFIPGIFSQMDPQQFPLLKTMHISTNVGRDENFALFNPSCCFETVKELSIECVDSFLDDWINLFPNITKLKLTFGSGTITRNLRPYLFAMLKLQYLDILIETSVAEGVNILLWLSGIDDPGSLNWESEEVVAKYKETHDNPSIYQLTELKEVQLFFDEDPETVNQRRDAAVCLAFLHTHKLDLLRFHGVTISDECAAKLRAHHRGFLSLGIWRFLDVSQSNAPCLQCS